MTPEQEENMEAALLAGMVKSKMKTIDSMMHERPTVPADRIDLHSFVRQAQQSSPPVQQIAHSAEIQPIHVSNIPISQPVLQENVKFDDETRANIKNILTTLEKINNNLTKLSGMFGKVFHTLTKNK